MNKRRSNRRKSNKPPMAYKYKVLTVLAVIIWGLLVFGIAGTWDYQQQHLQEIQY